MMERAVLADKKNPLPRYQKANILLSMDNLDGALAVLEELKEYAPCESSVYALMGNIYKRRNMFNNAMLNFGLALDLKPSATDVALIKVTKSFLSCLWAHHSATNVTLLLVMTFYKFLRIHKPPCSLSYAGQI